MLKLMKYEFRKTMFSKMVLPGIGLAFLFTVVMYVISGWIMEKRLSV